MQHIFPSSRHPLATKKKKRKEFMVSSFPFCGNFLASQFAANIGGEFARSAPDAGPGCVGGGFYSFLAAVNSRADDRILTKGRWKLEKATQTARLEK